MFADVFFIIQWWLVLFLLGLLFFPLTSLLFGTFLDKGYAFSKTLGIILLSYVMLVAGTLHILPFSLLSLLILLLLLTGGSTYLILKAKRLSLTEYIQSTVSPITRLAFVEEVLFLFVLSLFSIIRGYSPDINGLEKFMDYGFITTILRTDYFPPKDMWLTPFAINYYYFGHLATAVLTKLSMLPSYYTYNLMVGALAGLSFSTAFSLAVTLYHGYSKQFRLYRSILAGVLSAAILTFGGNLHTIYTFFLPYQNEKPQPFWELVFSPQTFPNSYWYPNATRFIHNTIHEFPMYSWTVSDLHGHVLDIPFVLLTIAYTYALFLLFSQGKKQKTLQPSKMSRLRSYYLKLERELPVPLPYLLLLSLFLAILYMTNAWDGIIYFLLSLLLLAYLIGQKILQKKGRLLVKLVILIAEMVIPVVILGIGFFLFSLPFSLFFKPFVSGVGILCAPSFLTDLGSFGPLLFEPDHCQRSPFWQLMILHGFFYFFVLAFLIFLVKTKKVFKSDVFILMLILLSTFLIILPEFIYMKDIYPAHYRANTMFKLVFQSFIMFSLVSGYSIARIAQYLKAMKTTAGLLLYLGFFAISLILLTLIFIYPYFAVMSYYGELEDHKGLHGTAYLKERYPTDYEAIRWLNQNVSGQPVILEAQGDSYTDFARVSANTGLPTVLGWTVHEWLWRGTYDVPAPRIEEVKTLYESDDLNQTRQLIDKYDIEYVFLGDLERQKYENLNEEKFERLGEIVFVEGQTMIYKIDLK